MYEELQEAVRASSGGGSKNFDLLTADEKRDVIEFIEWFEDTGVTKNTVNSYKSYVTKGLLKHRGVIEGQLTNDEKSGIRKFLAWYKSVDRDEVRDDEETEDQEV